MGFDPLKQLALLILHALLALVIGFMCYALAKAGPEWVPAYCAMMAAMAMNGYCLVTRFKNSAGYGFSF